MKLAAVLAIVATAAAAGCTAGDANPHLLAPKVIVQPIGPGNMTLFVRSAFGDQLYDELAVRIDNVTVAERTEAFSIEATVPGDGFFLEVHAALDAQTYELRGRIDVLPDGERAVFVALDPEGRWQTPATFTLPYERIIERWTQ